MKRSYKSTVTLSCIILGGELSRLEKSSIAVFTTSRLSIGTDKLKKQSFNGFNSHNEDMEFGNMATSNFLSEGDDSLTIKLI